MRILYEFVWMHCEIICTLFTSACLFFSRIFSPSLFFSKTEKVLNVIHQPAVEPDTSNIHTKQSRYVFRRYFFARRCFIFVFRFITESRSTTGRYYPSGDGWSFLIHRFFPGFFRLILLCLDFQFGFVSIVQRSVNNAFSGLSKNSNGALCLSLLAPHVIGLNRLRNASNLIIILVQQH